MVQRKNGPAKIYDGGTEIWCLNGYWHRADGPAVTGIESEYYIMGKKYSKEDYYLINKFPYLW